MKARNFLIKYFAVSCLVSIVLVSFTLGRRPGNNTFFGIAVQLFILSGMLFNHIKENYNKITDPYMYKLTAGICLISLLFIPTFSKQITLTSAIGYAVSIASINAIAVFAITFFSIKIIESTPPDSQS